MILMFNIKGIMAGVQRNAGKLATIYGYYNVQRLAYPTLGVIELFLKPIEDVTKEGIPSLEKIIWRLTESDYGSPTFKNGLLLLIGSELAKGIVPSKWTSLGQKIGQGLATGAVVASVLTGQSPAGEPHFGSRISHSGSGKSENPMESVYA